MNSLNSPSRRRFVTGLTASTALSMLPLSALSRTTSGLPELSSQKILGGRQFDLNIGYAAANYTGRSRVATAINGSIPGPALRCREGEQINLNVTNNLAVDSSIHWHGILLPSNMDGVPGLSFQGIKPGQSFGYQFDLKQSGTYWYHSHSGFQEQTGMYGALVVEPKGDYPYHFDRDYTVLLSDWSDEAPERIFAKLKKSPHVYNINERTLNDWLHDVQSNGLKPTRRDRAMWNQMRMSDSDLSDVTGRTYTFLMNGKAPADGWVGLFTPGEKVLLRFINAAAMTFFDVRIPGLKMTVVAADGQAVEAISVDEFRIGAAETYDVIVEPSSEQAHTLFCQAIDRSGYARGTLTPDPSWVTQIPEMDDSPVLSHADMGMASDHNAHSMNADLRQQTEPTSTCSPEHAAMGHCQEEQQTHHADMPNVGMPGKGSARAVSHTHIQAGPGIDMLASNPQLRLSDPGVGLRNNGRHVLTYADLFNLQRAHHVHAVDHHIELHLTGNMARYMWSIDGIPSADAAPISLSFGMRYRITLVNNTMMSHPMHLHGMWSQLETGDGYRMPRKHTVIVQPGSKISYIVDADAMGRWAFHCHLLYHMSGMFREVYVS